MPDGWIVRSLFRTVCVRKASRARRPFADDWGMVSDVVQIIFQDVDGCLNPADGEAFGVAVDWEPSANQIQMLEAIDAALERSPVQHFVINSGRPWTLVRSIAQYFRSSKARYFLLEHACVLYDRDTDTMVDCEALANRYGMTDLAARYGNLKVIHALFDWYESTGQAQLEAIYGAELTRVDKVGNLSFVIPEGVDGEAILEHVESLARAQMGDAAIESLDFVRSDSYVDILPGIHKLDGIHLLAAHLGIDLKHALAVGDYLNDLSVFESFSRVFCPANAHPQIKALAESKGVHGGVSSLTYGPSLLELLGTFR